MHIELLRDQSFIEQLLTQLEENQKLANWASFKRTYNIAESSLISDSKYLTALDQLKNVEFLPHQIKTAETVINDMNGRAILADEVGLGKTIEAGLIIKEYLTRRLIKKILIIVPASLVNQWASELYEKFFIKTTIAKKNPDWTLDNIQITSIDLAKREPHRSIILEQQYDLLLIDEAHKLKNKQTKNYQFARAISKKYCLLLTATPIQNKLDDLFNLVSLLKPGLLGDQDTFTKTYTHGSKKLDQELKKLIKKVMIRHLRQDTALNTKARKVKNLSIKFSELEKQFYQELEQATIFSNNATRILHLREFCSSREALYMTLNKADHKDVPPLIEKLKQLPHHAKAVKLIELIQSIDDKCIVFTEYRATQVYLQWMLNEHGISSVLFRGGFKRGKKDWMKQLFKDQAQVLIATEAAGEGINLQFCHHLINYDLPWNPMRIEQRIGRIHRYGQENDVKIYNFSIENSIEDHVLNLLYNKINLFERVVGELDQILADLNIQSFDTEINQLINQSKSVGEIKIKLDNLAEVIHDHKIERNEDVENGNRESS